LLTCGVVYAIGFYTGSRMQDRAPDEERIVRLPVVAEPPGAGQRAKVEDDFTFYDTLVPGSSRASQVVEPIAPERPATTPANADAAANRSAPSGTRAKTAAKTSGKASTAKTSGKASTAKTTATGARNATPEKAAARKPGSGSESGRQAAATSRSAAQPA